MGVKRCLHSTPGGWRAVRGGGFGWRHHPICSGARNWSRPFRTLGLLGRRPRIASWAEELRTFGAQAGLNPDGLESNSTGVRLRQLGGRESLKCIRIANLV